MADAKKCDRCKTLYEIKDEKTREYFIYTWNKEERETFQYHKKKSRDLCKSCYKRLLDFLDGTITQPKVDENSVEPAISTDVQKTKKVRRKRSAYPYDMLDFVKHNMNFMGNEALAEAVNKKFGLDMSPANIGNYLFRNGIKRKNRPLIREVKGSKIDKGESDKKYDKFVGKHLKKLCDEENEKWIKRCGLCEKKIPIHEDREVCDNCEKASEIMGKQVPGGKNA